MTKMELALALENKVPGTTLDPQPPYGNDD